METGLMFVKGLLSSTNDGCVVSVCVTLMCWCLFLESDRFLSLVRRVIRSLVSSVLSLWWCVVVLRLWCSLRTVSMPLCMARCWNMEGLRGRQLTLRWVWLRTGSVAMLCLLSLTCLVLVWTRLMITQK